MSEDSPDFHSAIPLLCHIAGQATKRLAQEGCVLLKETASFRPSKISIEQEFSVNPALPPFHVLLWIKPLKLLYSELTMYRLEVCLGSALKPSQLTELACVSLKEMTLDNVCLIYDTTTSLETELSEYFSR